MQIFPEAEGVKARVRNLSAELGRLIAVWRQMGDIEPPELRRLFEDHNLIRRTPLAHAAPADAHSHSLLRLMNQLGLDHAVVRGRRPGLMRRLERNCAKCQAALRCQEDIEGGSAASTFGAYCANALALAELQQEEARPA